RRFARLHAPRRLAVFALDHLPDVAARHACLPQVISAFANMCEAYTGSHISVKPHMMYARGMARPQGRFSLDLLFRALADPTRLRLLNLLQDPERSVCYPV